MEMAMMGVKVVEKVVVGVAEKAEVEVTEKLEEEAVVKEKPEGEKLVEVRLVEGKEQMAAEEIQVEEK